MIKITCAVSLFLLAAVPTWAATPTKDADAAQKRVPQARAPLRPPSPVKATSDRAARSGQRDAGATVAEPILRFGVPEGK